MKLTEAERQDPLWQKVERHINERIAAHRLTNDSLTMQDIVTAQIRGRIAELKDLLKIGQPAAHAPGETNDPLL